MKPCIVRKSRMRVPGSSLHLSLLQDKDIKHKIDCQITGIPRDLLLISSEPIDARYLLTRTILISEGI